MRSVRAVCTDRTRYHHPQCGSAAALHAIGMDGIRYAEYRLSGESHRQLRRALHPHGGAACDRRVALAEDRSCTGVDSGNRDSEQDGPARRVSSRLIQTTSQRYLAIKPNGIPLVSENYDCGILRKVGFTSTIPFGRTTPELNPGLLPDVRHYRQCRD